MLPIQILLSGALGCFFLYALSQKRNSLFVSYAMIVIVMVGAFFLWFPDSTNAIARHLGISRGADLMLYGFIVMGLVVSFNLHLRQRRQNEKITQIVRYIAIENVLRENANQSND